MKSSSNLLYSDTFNNPDTTTIGTVTAIYEIGCFFGAILTFYIGDKLGRKNAIWVGLATVLQTTAFGVGHMIVGRIVTGIGNGINTSTVPMWVYSTVSLICMAILTIAQVPSRNY